MMRTAKVYALMMIFCLQCSAASLMADIDGSSIHVKAGNMDYIVEIADTRELQRRGLMNRATLAASHGLLMVFKQDKKVPIWMKNTLIPLDVVWLSSGGQVVDIKTLPVCKGVPCQIYYPEEPARYVLEVGAGLFSLKRGDKVEIIDASGDSLLPSDLAR